MSAPRFMPFYVADYLADTTHLTQTEHGAYLLLLMAMWRAGGTLPADDAKLARFSSSTRPQWQRIRDTVLAFFTVEGGFVTSRRLTYELTKYEATLSQKSGAGKKSAEARSLKKQENTPTAVATKSNDIEIETEKERNISLAKANSSKTRFAGFDQFWSAYPRKTGKGSAEKSFAKAMQSIADPEPLVVLLMALDRVKATWTDPQFIPLASTWLIQRRWEDEPETATVIHIRPGLAKSYSEQAAETWTEASKRLEEKWQAE